MQIEDLNTFPANSVFEADLAIIGGGPAGLTVAREFFGTSIRVLLLESGLLDETPDHAALAELDSVGEPRTDAQKQKNRLPRRKLVFMVARCTTLRRSLPRARRL